MDEHATTPGRMIVALAPPVMLAGVSAGMAFPILPSVGMRVGLPVAFIGLVLAANRIVRVLVSPSVGSLIDRFGGRRAMIAGLLLQAAGMIAFVFGVTTAYPGTFFLVGRVLHGMGGAGVFIAAQALALHGGGPTHAGRVAGAVRAAIQLGVPIGLVSAGFLADLSNEVVTFAAGAAGVALSAITTFALVPDLRVQAAPRTPVVRALREMANARLAALGALGFASAFAGSGVVLTTVALLVHVERLSAFGLPERATSSVLMGWLVVTEAAAMPWLGRLGDKKDVHAEVALAGLLFTIPGLVVLAFAVRVPTVALGMGILGVGVAGMGPSLLALLGRIVPPERRGLGIGALQVASDIGGALGPLAGSALFAGSLATPYLVAAAVNALLLPFGWSLVRRTR
ncbi:MAG: MFS transporter [Labilithrix sp.]|nr:MFS transporter [Labilithrix sp.]MCW5813199.1 MFS transporter [Labilithrix sp.]